MIEKMMQWMFVLSAMVVLTGCNTIAGVGKDIERGGEAIQRAVR